MKRGNKRIYIYIKGKRNNNLINFNIFENKTIK